MTSDQVIITGGSNSKQVVSLYDMEGWVKDLPQLIEGRWYHGCGSYLRLDGTQVSVGCVVYSCVHVVVQVLR